MLIWLADALFLVVKGSDPAAPTGLMGSSPLELTEVEVLLEVAEVAVELLDFWAEAEAGRQSAEPAPMRISPVQASSPSASSKESMTLLPAGRAGVQVIDCPSWSPRSERTSPHGSEEATATRLNGALPSVQLSLMGVHCLTEGGVSMMKSPTTPWMADAKRAIEMNVEANIFAGFGLDGG